MKRLIKQNQQIFTQIITCEEKGKKLIFECNGTSFYKIKIDTPELPNNLSRCDYAIALCDLKSIVLFVELKGSNINKAFSQIITSKNEFGKDFEKIYGAIVFGGSIPAGTTEQNILVKARKNGFLNMFFKRNLKLSFENNQITKL